MSKGEGANERPVARADGRYVPTEIKEFPIWTMWDLRKKVARAPWTNGHCYPTYWKGDLDEDARPERTYEEVARYTSLGPTELDRLHSFPREDTSGDPIDNPVPERIEPTILLPHEHRAEEIGAARWLMYIDFDDVRDPETEEITEEVQEILDRLDSYTEVSSSGTGLHVLVFAQLPYGIPDIDGRELDEKGSIEMYDHARFFAATWDHVKGTAKRINDSVQDVVTDLVETYAPDRVKEALGKDDDDIRPVPDSAPEGSSSSSSSSGDRSPYYDVDTEDFAEPDPVEVDTTDRKQGAHPDHGKTTSGDKSTNYNLDIKSGQWYCFACSGGGGAMEMAAVMNGTLDCGYAGAGSLGTLSNAELLETCLYARDNLNGFTEEMDPPYRALVAVAEHYDMPMADPDEGILGPVCYKCARGVYDEMDADDLGVGR